MSYDFKPRFWVSLDGNFWIGARRLQRFPHPWKDADPDVPILKQAKAEYAKLQ